MIITGIKAREILDSRGFPTVEVDLILDSGIIGRASVPSGASTGTFEALEKRDQDPDRMMGKGVLNVIDNIHNQIFQAIEGLDVTEQREIDAVLNTIDGTDNKSNLGANATLAVSLASARAAASYLDAPLYKYLGGACAHTLPIPLINIINGGAHADNTLDIQEFMIVPHGFDDFKVALQASTEVFHVLKVLLKGKGLSISVGDEGGFAPQLSQTEEALDLICQAIEKAGYTLSDQISVALDVAANECFDQGQYQIDHQTYTSEKLVSFYADLVNKYPIVSIEDGLAEDDWEGWTHLTSVLGQNIQLVGDDLFVTNPVRLKKGIELGAANAILIKPNQIGTLTETIDTIKMAQKRGYKYILSHRSGETEDTFIADLAVAMGGGQIKTGALSRTDRTSKYNQLLRIYDALCPHVLYG